MADFNKILTPGDYKNGIINVVVEIPTGSTHKIEWNLNWKLSENTQFLISKILLKNEKALFLSKKVYN